MKLSSRPYARMRTKMFSIQFSLSHLRWVSLLSLLLMAIGVSVSAAAAHETGTHDDQSAAKRAQREAEFTVRGSKGYSIKITVSSHDAVLAASRKHMAALYRTEDATMHGDSFSARFARFGNVHVVFSPRPSSEVKQQDHCSKGRKPMPGILVGVVFFRGEKNFTAVHVKRAKGRIWTRDSRNICSAEPHGGKQSNSTRYKLHSVSFGRRQTVAFRAGRGAIAEVEKWEREIGVPLGLSAVRAKPVGFSATSISRKSGVSIVRLVAAGAKPRSFMASADNTVSVNPPAPFEGAGLMNICRPSSWRGDLRVQFPGEEVVLARKDAFTVIEPVPSSC
jgi:hypothetical protein